MPHKNIKMANSKIVSKKISHSKFNVIDEEQLAQDLQQLAHGKQSANFAQDVRLPLIARLKDAINEGKAKAEDILKQNGKGLECAKRISRLTDIVIMQLYDFVTTFIFPQQNPTSGERIALIAVGGYGRGTMAPYSDIDIQFLLPWKQTPWGEQVSEYILYILWDMGLKVGHATRNINDTIRIAKDDMTVRTALLEARFLVGNHELYDELIERYNNEIIPGTGPDFIKAKLLERDERHRKSGEARYLVEPNIKEGKGGQRDLQTLGWLVSYFYRIKTFDQLANFNIISKKELSIFKKANDFLWAVRAHMHFITGKAKEKLTFDIQREIAHRFGYTEHPGLKDVERFMKHYFLIAKQVGNLTRSLCAELEEAHAKSAPGQDILVQSANIKHKEISESKDFIIDNQRINITDDEVFARDPVNLIRLFYFADKYDLEYHPRAIQVASRSLRFIDTHLRENKQANALFLAILTSKKDPAKNLTRMNDTGVLGKFIPQFGKVVAMMQFNMYHHFTVDEHLIRCIEYLSKIENGTVAKEHPLTTTLLPLSERERHILYVATFLHDIAKGRPENHSIGGERIARKLAPRFGLNPIDTDNVAWLIREHLTMSKVSQSRDLNDRKTIDDFAKIVQTSERLKLLMILTICDINGVGYGVWNGWKGQLLRTLYYETEIILTGGFSKCSNIERINYTKELLASSLSHWEDTEKAAYLNSLYSNYWLTTPLEDQIKHAEFIKQADDNKQIIATTHQLFEFEAITEIIVLAPDYPSLLSAITGACAGAGGNIVDAQIFTTRDGRALDIIVISREFDLAHDEIRRAKRIEKMIVDVLEGRVKLPEMLAQRTKPKRNAKAFKVLPRIEINNSLSDKFTVIEIKGLDRTGLLSGLTRKLSDLELNITSAHITTFGEKVIDTFYVTDLNGHKIIDVDKQNTIKEKIFPLLENT